MGLFSWIGDRIRKVFGGGGEPAPAPATPPQGEPSDLEGGFFGEGEQNLPYADTVPFDFELAGFLPLEADFNTGYVDTLGQTVDVSTDIPWPEIDYVVVRITEPNGSTYYTTFVGPFDDYDDFFLDLVAWWEEGSV